MTLTLELTAEVREGLLAQARGAACHWKLLPNGCSAMRRCVRMNDLFWEVITDIVKDVPDEVFETTILVGDGGLLLSVW